MIAGIALRGKQVTERRTFLGGGVGGVEIHVGGTGERLSGVSAATLEHWVISEKGGCAERSTGREDALALGVHKGEAVIDGSGRNPQRVRLRGGRAELSFACSWA